MNNPMVSNPMVSNPVMTSPLETKASPGLEAPLHETDRLTQLTLNSNGRDSLSSASPDEADRVEFDGPVSAAQLFLPLTLPPAASSLFLDHWEEALKALVAALAAHSPLAERQALAVLEQAQTVFGLFVPRFATAETLAETDRQAVGARASEWVLLCCEVLQTALREGHWSAMEFLFTGLMNVVAAPFAAHAAIAAVRMLGARDA